LEKQSACTFSVQCKDEVHPLLGCLPSFFLEKELLTPFLSVVKMKIHCIAVYLAFSCIISLMWKVTFRGGKFWANSTSLCWLRIFSLALGPDCFVLSFRYFYQAVWGLEHYVPTFLLFTYWHLQKFDIFFSLYWKTWMKPKISLWKC